MRVALRFATVTFGTEEICDTDFVEIYDIQTVGGQRTRTLASRFCGSVSFSLCEISRRMAI